MTGPLDGITIADFTTAHQGPWATQKLGDMGADVIKIERPGGEWSRNLTSGGGYDINGMSPFWLSANRSKRSITLDLKSDEGKQIALEIADRSDVLIENFRPEVMERLGLGYDAVSEKNSDIIYVSASGFGSDGPLSDRPGQDLLMQALTGIAQSVGRRDDPPTPIPFPVIDGHSAMQIVNSTLAALFYRERTGRGQKVEVDLLSSAVDSQCQAFTVELNIDYDYDRSEEGIGQKYLDAPYGIYETQEGHIAIAMATMEQIAEVFELPELTEYEDHETFYERDEIKRIIEDHTRDNHAEDLLEDLIKADIWAARVNDFQEAAQNPQIQHNDMIVEIDHPENGSFSTTGISGTLTESELEIQDRPPRAGEHTDEILEEIGYDNTEIKSFAETGVTEK